MQSHPTRQPIPCPHCGKLFTPKRTRRACSTQCGSFLRESAKGHGHIQVVCLTCGKGFAVAKGRAKSGRGIYCSKACHKEGQVKVTDPVAAYWSLVVKGDGCWGWSGRTSVGYGVISSRKKLLLAHRISWEVHNGPIPNGLCVLHRCDNPPCSNPAHLFLGTKPENISDCVTKGRNAFGSRNAKAKLTEESVAEIRRRWEAGEFGRWKRGRAITDIARAYGVDATTIRCVVSGKTWKHVS